MMQSLIDRPAFNKQYNYHLTIQSDNIHLKSCENCGNLSAIKTNKNEECFVMVSYGIPCEKRDVEKNGLCNLYVKGKHL
jgi:uncharacterized Zn finger protein